MNAAVGLEDEILNLISDFSSTNMNSWMGEFVPFAAKKALLEGDTSFLTFFDNLEQQPAGIEQFLDDPYYLGALDITWWPVVRQTVIDLNKYWWKGLEDGAFQELLCKGATNTGKTEIMRASLIYRLHVLGCLKSPQKYYGKPAHTTISWQIMAARNNVAKRVLYKPIRAMIGAIPWFSEHMRYDPLIENEMVFADKNIVVQRKAADESNILGDFIMGALMDEANHMAVISHSKKAKAYTGRAGLYDQAKAVHSALSARITGRNKGRGPIIQLMAASSQTAYQGEFTDFREKQILDASRTDCLIYHKRTYEVMPLGDEDPRTFRVAIPHDPHLLPFLVDGESDEELSECKIEVVPWKYRNQFVDDIHKSIRDYCGFSSVVIDKFIKQPYKIVQAMEMWDNFHEEMDIPQIFVKQNVELAVDGMPKIARGVYCRNPTKRRYVHVDLSKNGDRCGIAQCMYLGSIEVEEGNQKIMMPVGLIEFAISLEPSKESEVIIEDVRELILTLKEDYGYPITSVTFDGFESLDSTQIFRSMGIRSKVASVDISSTPYRSFRSGIYQNRCLLPNNSLLLEELTFLEHDIQKDKIDHPDEDYSKDIADAACGAYYQMLLNHDTWTDTLSANRDSARPKVKRRKVQRRAGRLSRRGA